MNNTYVWRRWHELDLLVRHMTLANMSFNQRVADAPPRAIHVYAMVMRSPFWAALNTLSAAYQRLGDNRMAQHALIRDDVRYELLNGLARVLDRTSPKDLLAIAVPEAPANLMKALDRCGDLVHDAAFYDTLMRLLRVPAFEAALLARNTALDMDLLKRLEAASHLGAMTLKAFAEKKLSCHNAELLQSVIDAAVDVHGPVVLPVFEDALAQWNPGKPSEHCDRLLSRLPAARAPWAGNNSLSPVTTTAQLKALGRRFSNCAAEYRLHMILGARAFYTWNGAGMPALLCICRQYNDRWAFHELKGPRNATVPAAQDSEIRTHLRAAGISAHLSITRTLEGFHMAQLHDFRDFRFAPD